ncbi:MAG: GGDEF domain-containing protein [Acidimicrobiales bacterium]|nr:GGDEF domain-containing protein [Acidimicrobiales bacterium]
MARSRRFRSGITFSLATLRLRLMLLVGFSLLPAILLILNISVDQRNASLADASTEVKQIAAEISAEQGLLAQATQQLVTSLAQVKLVENYTSQDCSNLLGSIAGQLLAYANIAVADLNGSVKCSALPFTGAISVANQSFFKQTMETQSFSLGDITVGRISKTEVIAYGAPIYNPQKQVIGVIYASVSLSYLSSQPLQLSLPNSTQINITTPDGKVLATLFGNKSEMGQNMFAVPTFQSQVGASISTASTFSATGLDGTPRLYAAAELGSSGQGISGMVIAGLPLSPIEKQADQDLLFGLLGMAAVVLAGEGAAWLIGVRLFGRMQRLATTDPLTGVFNRNHSMELGERELRRSERSRFPLAVAILDLDFFKNVNDTHGHAVGDNLLKVCAKACLNGCRDVDIVGRYGGEEFIIILPDADALEAIVICERIRVLIANSKVSGKKGVSVGVTASVGIAETTSESRDLKQLLVLADAALYRAKESGRDQVIVSD